MVCYAEPLVWIIVSYAEQVVVNHGVLFSAHSEFAL
jgi:hypothetical protein